MAIPHQQPPAEEQLVETNAFEAELFWHKNKNLILIIAIAVVVAALAAILWLRHTQSQRLASQALFAESKDAAAWQKVITEYPKSEAAANSYFLLASAQRDAGDVDASSATYQAYLDAFPTHQLAGAAQLGIAENLLSKGKDAEAIAKLRQLQAGSSAAYAASFSAFVEGRILMLQGKLPEARKVFATVVQVYPATPPASLAGELLQEIDLLVPPAAPAVAPSATPAQ